ncbi:MAG: hypothetical protein JSS79_07900 [Bacteroidetes bacterium]|nr:hypothetical protein [Bacteroidota bacterium]
MQTTTTNPVTLRRWIWFSFAGWLIGLVVMLIFADFASNFKLDISWIGTSMAAGLGFMQWLALRKYAHVTLRWFWFTILGTGSAYLFFNLLYLGLISIPAFGKLKSEAGMEFIIPLASTVGGFLTGWLQQRFILHQYTPNSRRWMWANCLGWFLCSTCITVYLTLAGNFHFHHYPAGKALNTIMVLSGGVILGWTTGKTLIPLVKGK